MEWYPWVSGLNVQIAADRANYAARIAAEQESCNSNFLALRWMPLYYPGINPDGGWPLGDDEQKILLFEKDSTFSSDGRWIATRDEKVILVMELPLQGRSWFLTTLVGKTLIVSRGLTSTGSVGKLKGQEPRLWRDSPHVTLCDNM